MPEDERPSDGPADPDRRAEPLDEPDPPRDPARRAEQGSGQPQGPPPGDPTGQPQGPPPQEPAGRPRGGSTRGGARGQFERLQEMILWPVSVAAGIAVWVAGFVLTYGLMWVMDVLDEIEEDTLDIVVLFFYESFGGSVSIEDIDVFLTPTGYAELGTDWFGVGPFLHALVPLFVLIPAGYIVAGRHVRQGQTERPLEAILAGISTSIWVVGLFFLSVLIVDVDGVSVDMVELIFVTLMYSVVFTAIGATMRSRARLVSGWGVLGGLGAFVLGLFVWVFVDDPFDDGLLVASIADRAEVADDGLELPGELPWELVTVGDLGLDDEGAPYTIAEGFSDLSGSFDHFYVFSGFVTQHGREPGAIFPEWFVMLVPLLVGAGLAYVYEVEDTLVGLGEGAKLGTGYVVAVFSVTLVYIVTEVQALESAFDDWPRDPIDTIETLNIIIGTAGGDIVVGGIVYPVVFAAIGGALGAFVYRTRNQPEGRPQAGYQEPAGEQPPQGGGRPPARDTRPPQGGQQPPAQDTQRPPQGGQPPAEPFDRPPAGTEQPADDEPPADHGTGGDGSASVSGPNREPADGATSSGEATGEELSPGDILGDDVESEDRN